MDYQEHQRLELHNVLAFRGKITHEQALALNQRVGEMVSQNDIKRQSMFASCILSVYYRKKNYTDNERALLILGIIFSCFAIVFNGVYVARILDWIPQNIGMEKIIVWVAGLLLCSFGIVFCTVKTKINSILGVRTRWSIQSEEVWAKSQKSGGRVFIADSVSMLVVGVFLKGSLCMIVAFSIVIISVPIIVFFTHQISIKH